MFTSYSNLLSLSVIKRSCILSAPFVYFIFFLKDPSSNACSSNEGCFSHRGAYYGTAQYIVFCLFLTIFTSSFLDMGKPKFFHASHLKVTGESIPNCVTQSSLTTCDSSRFCSTKDDGHVWANGKCSSHFLPLLYCGSENYFCHISPVVRICRVHNNIETLLLL